MAKKEQNSQEKQVLTEWQKRNLEFLRKKESEDSEGIEKENTPIENKVPEKKKVKKKKKAKKKKKNKLKSSSNIPIHNKILLVSLSSQLLF